MYVCSMYYVHTYIFTYKLEHTYYKAGSANHNLKFNDRSLLFRNSTYYTTMYYHWPVQFKYLCIFRDDLDCGCSSFFFFFHRRLLHSGERTYVCTYSFFLGCNAMQVPDSEINSIRKSVERTSYKQTHEMFFLRTASIIIADLYYTSIKNYINKRKCTYQVYLPTYIY